MTTKAVIEIDVLDEKFKAFEAALAELQKVVGKLPNSWKSVTSEIENANKSVEKGEKETEKIDRKRKDREAQKRYDEKRDNDNRKKNNEDQRIAQNNALQQYREVSRVTGSIAKNLAAGTIAVAKWVTLGAIGGGFGFGGLAAAASNARKEAGGLGVSTGELRAAKVAYGRYLDNPEASLSNIAQMQQDYLGRAKLSRIAGKDVSQESSGQALSDTLQNAVKMYQANKNNLPYLQATGVTDVYSLQELRRLAALPEKERNEAIAQYGQLSKKYGVSDPTSKAWQDFMVHLQDAGQTIEVSFIKNLRNITPALDSLTSSISKAIDEFLSSKQFGEAVKVLSGKIVQFGKYLGSQEFQDDISKFMDAVGRLVDDTEQLADWIDKITGKTHFDEQEEKRQKTFEEARQDYDKGNVAQKAIAFARMDRASQDITLHKDLKSRGNQYIDYLTQKGWTKEQAAGIVGNLAQESSLNPAAVNKEGMAGLAQWDQKRRAEFQKMYGVPVQNATWQQQLDFINYELTKGGEQGAGAALKKATTAQQASQVIMDKYERPGDNSGSRRANYAAAFLHYAGVDPTAKPVAAAPAKPVPVAPTVKEQAAKFAAAKPVPAAVTPAAAPAAKFVQSPPTVDKATGKPTKASSEADENDALAAKLAKMGAANKEPAGESTKDSQMANFKAAYKEYAGSDSSSKGAQSSNSTAPSGAQGQPGYVNSMPKVQVSVNTQAGANVYTSANALPGGA